MLRTGPTFGGAKVFFFRFCLKPLLLEQFSAPDGHVLVENGGFGSSGCVLTGAGARFRAQLGVVMGCEYV